MRSVTLAMFGLFCSACAAWGQSPHAEDLNKACTSASGTPGDSVCKTWVSGFYSGLAMAQVDASTNHKVPATCLPSGSGAASTDQMRLIIQKFMRDNPQLLNQPMEMVAFLAIQGAFPCPKSN